MKTRNFFFIGVLVLYAVLLFVGLTLARMPVERLVAAKVHDASGGRVSLRMEALDLGFPDRIHMTGVLVQAAAGRSRVQGRLSSLRMRPDYGGLLRGYLPVRFLAASPAGTLEGRIGVSPGKGMQDGYVAVQTDGFVLERFPSLSSFLDRGLRGNLSARMDLRGNLRSLDRARGEGALRIANGSVEARLGLPGLDRIPFESLEMAFLLENGVLSLSQADMTGPAFSGVFRGDIELEKRLSRSRLRLEGTLTPGPLVLENAFLSRFLQNVLKGEQSVRVRVRGTLESPAVVRDKG